MSLSNYLELELLDHVFGCGTLDYPGPANIYAALFTTDPTDAGTGTEVSSATHTWYARVAANSWNTASERSISNSAAINFAQITGSLGVTVTHVGFYDASTGGNLLVYAELDEQQYFVPGNVPSFSAGRIGVSFTTGVISDYLANKLLDHVFNFTTKTAVYASHVAATEVITTAAHGLTASDNGKVTVLTTTGTAPGGLTAGTIYYFKYASATTFTLHTTAAGAVAGTGTVDLDATVATGTNTFQFNTYTWSNTDRYSATVATYSSHAGATEIITAAAAHGFTADNDGMALVLATTGTPPTGLTAGTVYYFNYVGATTFTLHDTEDHAIADSDAIDLTDGGAAGVNTFHRPPETHVSLYTTEPGDDDSGSELSGGGYARMLVAPTSDTAYGAERARWTVASGGSVENEGAIEDTDGAPFTAANPLTSAWMQINYLAIHDAATSGNLLFYGASTRRPTLSTADDTYAIADGNLDVTLD